MLLSDLGAHTQLNMVDSNGDPQRIFPVNTGDDVYVNENGNNLTQYLPTVKSSVALEEDAAMHAEESATDTISDALAAIIIGS